MNEQTEQPKISSTARNTDRIHALIYHPATTRYLCGRLRDDSTGTFEPILTTPAGALFEGSLEMAAKHITERTDGRVCDDCRRIVTDEARVEAAKIAAFRAEQRARLEEPQRETVGEVAPDLTDDEKRALALAINTDPEGTVAADLNTVPFFTADYARTAAETILGGAEDLQDSLDLETGAALSSAYDKLCRKELERQDAERDAMLNRYPSLELDENGRAVDVR